MLRRSVNCTVYYLECHFELEPHGPHVLHKLCSLAGLILTIELAPRKEGTELKYTWVQYPIENMYYQAFI